MILTGKALEDFWKWISLNRSLIINYHENHVLSDMIEFFDSVGIWSSVVSDMLILDKHFFSNGSWVPNVKELAVIANEIYNNR